VTPDRPPARRLLLDIQAAQDPVHGDRGLGRVSLELAAELDRRPGAVAGVLLDPALPPPRHIPPSLAASPRLGWNTPATFAQASFEGPVAYWVLSPFERGNGRVASIPRYVLDSDVPLIVTLHDLIPLHDPERHLPGRAFLRYRVRCQLVGAADLVLCVSEYTRADAMARLQLAPGRCRVVGNGAAERFRPAQPGDDDSTVGLLGVSGDPVLAVTGGDERKNTPRLIEAYALLPVALREAHPLVVVCDLDPGVASLWRSVAARAGVLSQVVFTGLVDDDALVALYRRAALVVMPSLDEGYGLPVAEAIACGVPAVSSATSALPEILGLPESVFDPLDVGDMARVIERGLVDDGLRARLLAAGRAVEPLHRWPAVADRALEAVASLR
jgi:glycosyltransferase involved in cell wall biosynthesis